MIENNPGYAKYVPNTSSYPNNSAKNTGLASNSSTFTSKYANNTPSGQAGLIENNPGYAKYVPNTSSYPNNSTNTGAGYNGSISYSANNSHNNISNPIGGALANTSKAVGNIIEKGISSITNIGNKTTK